MSHNVHPYSFRIGILRGWKSRWFDIKTYHALLKCDTLLREWIGRRFRGSYIGAIEIERSPSLMHVIIKTSRPGLLIGKKGEGIERLKKESLRKMRRWNIPLPPELKISVEEIQSPGTNAAIVAQMIAEDLQKRLPFRRVIKKTIDKVMANKEVKGIKVRFAGRLDGSEMARREWLMKGRIPLQTLRADVDFARERAHLPYGDIGIKVWIYKGEIFDK